MNAKLKKNIVDLIILTGLPFLIIYVVYPKLIFLFDINKFGLKEFLLMLCFQFASAGLGSVLVMLIRRENFANFGLVKKNALKAILLSPLVYIPQIILTLSTYKNFVYIPMQHAIGPKALIHLNLFEKIIAYFIIITIWGFFEGFNCVVISDKVNRIFNSKNLFLNSGAIFCAVFMILIHLLLGACPMGWLDIIATFIIIYGMLVIREYTQNSWGCIFLFIFFWNAF